MSFRLLSKISIYFPFLFFSGIFIYVFFLVSEGPFFAYDDLAYHFPFVMHWLAGSNFLQVYFPAFAGPIGHYPANMELILFFTAKVFPSDQYFFVWNYLFIFVGIYLLGQVFRDLFRKNPPQSPFIKGEEIKCLFYDFRYWLASGIFLIPVFFSKIGITGVDTLFNVAFIGILWSLYFRKFLWFCIFCGVFVGTKYLGGFYLILLLPVILWRFWDFFVGVIHELPLRSFQYLQKFIGGIILFFIFGGWWYLRNFYVTGNPVFPQEILGFEGYRGISEKIWSESIWGNISWDWNFWGNFVGILYEKFWIWPFVVVFFLVFLLLENPPVSPFFKGGINWKSLWGGYFLLCVGTWILYVTSPFSFANLSENVRYFMPGIILIYIGFWWMIIFLGKYYGKFWRYFSQIFFLIFVVSVFPKNLEHIKSFQKNLPDFFMEDLQPIYEADQFLEKNYSGKKVVAYSGFNTEYFFYHEGENFLQNEVYHININDCQGCEYYDFRQVEKSIRSNPDEKSWLENLRVKNVDFLVVRDYPGLEMYEKVWAQKNPEIFEKIWGMEDVDIWRVK